MSGPGPTQGVFMISIAARLAGMHPQTLRVYERRGLIAPKRTQRNTRLYSQADVDLLRRIQQLSEEGLNLTGIERVLVLERRLKRAERRAAQAEARFEEAEALHAERLRELKREAAADLVPVAPVETALVRHYAPVLASTPRQVQGGARAR